MNIAFTGTKSEALIFLNTNYPLLTNKPANPVVGDKWICEKTDGTPADFSWEQQLNKETAPAGRPRRQLVYRECTATNVNSTLPIWIEITS